MNWKQRNCWKLFPLKQRQKLCGVCQGVRKKEVRYIFVMFYFIPLFIYFPSKILAFGTFVGQNRGILA